MSSSAPKLWAGRFAQETDALVHQFNASLSFDQRLWPYDIQGSIAHVKMLGECGIIPLEESETIQNGLETLAGDLKSGAAELHRDAEDVHMGVETLLTERLGPVAGKLHTARSRNDQVATDLRLYVREAIDSLREQIAAVQDTLITLAEAHGDTLLPGMTHLQHAQPVRLAHHLLAYFWMLARDDERLEDARKRVNVLPLGAGALAGTTFPINRQRVAEMLGFEGVVENSLDAVSDRDFAIETVSALALVMMHLSRLCEELILWSSHEYGWVVMADNVTTGSSIMPQKKNPDVAELVRGKTGRVFGDLTALLTVMKGLPLAYNKDMQEDKESLFDALDTAHISLSVINTLLQNTEFNTERMAASLHGDFSTATDLADYLVRQGLPFRQAHEVVGKIVGNCIRNGRVLEDLTREDLMAASLLFAEADTAALASPRGSADARAAFGGTGREAVAAQLHAPGSGGAMRKSNKSVPNKMTLDWFPALAFGVLTAAAGVAAGASIFPILLLAAAVGGGFLLAERLGWLRASENNSKRDAAVTALFSLLVLLFVEATGGADSPLLCALYLPILLATLCYGMSFGLWASLSMAASCALLFLSSSHPTTASLGPALALAFSYPVMAIFGGVLRAQMESRLRALSSEKQDITAMLDMSQMMEAAIDLDMTLNLILLNVQQHCECRVCAVYLKSADGRILELRAASGQRGKVSLLPAFPVDEARREIWNASEPSSAFSLAAIDPVSASSACLPLSGVEGLLGMLYVGCAAPNGMTADTVQRLEQIAVYAAFPLHRVLLQQDFRALAYSDPMTGLDNFRQFEATLADEMARAERYDHPLSLILLDIDHFKSFNDTLGHPAGDALLGQLGVVLRNCLRNVDRPARYGGEEFVIICPETGAREAHLIAERIRRSVAETAFTLLEKKQADTGSREGTTHVTVSLGCATYPGDARTARDLVKKADMALYDAKAAGRNTVRAYEGEQTRIKVA